MAGTAAGLSIFTVRQDTGYAMASDRITYSIITTNAGLTTPFTTIVVDMWSPVGVVVGVEAPGRAIDLTAGAITCTRTNLELESVLFPAPYLVFTTNWAFSGTLTNTATVTTTLGIVDSAPISVIVTRGHVYSEYLPLVLK